MKNLLLSLMLIAGSVMAFGQDNELAFPIDAECGFIGYNWEGFGGVQTKWVSNPDMSGNTSTRVFAATKFPGAQFWAGTVEQFTTPIDFSVGQVFTMNVWSPKPNVPVLFKLENATNSGIFNEVLVSTTTTNQWEELTFDFTGSGADTKDLHKVAVFFDFVPGPPNGDGSVYYFDDIQQVGNTGMTNCVGNEITFNIEFGCSASDLQLEGFGVSDLLGVDAAIISNPDVSGINKSASVVEHTKLAGAPFWAGSLLQTTYPIDLSLGSVFEFKSWSPKAGIPVLLKLENATDGGDFVEVAVNTTVANQWETLTFDVSSHPNYSPTKCFQKVVVFYEFIPDDGTGNPVNGDGSTYYYDDLSQVGNSSVSCSDITIPTMGQWALFILALMITSLGVVTIRRQAIA